MDSKEIKEIYSYFIKDSILSRKSESTLLNYKSAVNSLLNYIKQQDMPQVIERASKEVLEAYFLYGVNDLKWGKYTHWSHYKNLHSFFKWSVRNNYLRENPLLLISKPKQPFQYPKSLTNNEVQDLLNAIRQKSLFRRSYRRDMAIILTLLCTGIRRGELLQLKCKDVDFESNFIKIRHGKNDKYREIPIHIGVLRPILVDYLSYQGVKRHSDAFFTLLNSRKPLSDQSLKIIFKKLSLHLNKRIYPHQLRHTFATHLLEQTGNIYVLKELMGHSDIKTTCIYLSTTRKKKMEAINQMTIVA